MALLWHVLQRHLETCPKTSYICSHTHTTRKRQQQHDRCLKFCLCSSCLSCKRLFFGLLHDGHSVQSLNSRAYPCIAKWSKWNASQCQFLKELRKEQTLLSRSPQTLAAPFSSPPGLGKQHGCGNMRQSIPKVWKRHISSCLVSAKNMQKGLRLQTALN